ncbi:MAG: zinc ribbon domain-containing protein [Lachnospiraceae bacterium]|nr:zinc ribbon domain-containing protein [Lachnospiraceae bacterium]
MEIKCVNCGALFDDKEHYCPYCGHITAEEAEEKYMESLEDIREDLGEMADDGQEAAIDESVSVLKKIFKTVAIILIIFFIILIGFFLTKKVFNKSDADWQVKNYPKYESLYQEGKYEELLELYIKDKNDKKPVYAFKHSAFVEGLATIDSAKTAMKYVDSKTADDYWFTELLYDEMKCYAFEYQYGITADDLEILKEMAKDFYTDLSDRYGISDEELDSWLLRIKENDGIVRFTECEKYVKDKGLVED